LESNGERRTDKILLFIPAYNCAPQIVRVLRKLNDIPVGAFYEALVLDNQSRDETVQAALTVMSEVASMPVTIARNSRNYGLGGSHKSAFRYALDHGFTHVAVLHGDDQGSLVDLLPVLQSGLHLRADACLGSRFMGGAKTSGYSRLRILGNHCFNLLFSLALRQRITDLGSGLNLIGRTIFSDPSVLRYSDDLCFNHYLLLNLVDKGRRFEFFPISWREEDQVSNARLVSMTLKMLANLREYLFRRKRFRLDDHRSTPVAEYTFEVMGKNQLGLNES